MKCTIHDNIGTESGQWPVDGDRDTLVTYTRGVGEEGEKAEIQGPLGVPLDLGVRNNRRLRWPIVTLGDGSVQKSFCHLLPALLHFHNKRACLKVTGWPETRFPFLSCLWRMSTMAWSTSS